jgi:PKD repeat protein
MKMFMIILSLAVLSVSCEKDTSTGFTPDFVIKATPSTDSAGLVEFEATATNATGYTFDFGDGTTGTTADGKINHTYTKIGNNTFYVVVKAAGAEKTKTIEVRVNIVSNIPGLIWADEFDISGNPNPSNWTFEIGAGGWGNNELQYYTNRSQNATVSGGMLKITAIKENFNGSPYTSARLITKDKFDFKYGRVEIRAKLPAGGGTWPALWMLGSDISSVGWPACGEIDIMEHRGNDPNKIHGTIHYPGRSGGNPVTNTTTATNVSTTFHVYKCDWSASSIKIYVDDNLYFNVPNTQAIPFNKNFFLIVNIAMGGTFGGPVDPAFTSSSMEIDYIRVFSN